MTKTRKLLCIVLSSAVMIAMLLGTFVTGTIAMAAGDDQPITLVQSSLGEFTGSVSSFTCVDNKIGLGLTFHHLDESAELILEFHNSSDKDYYISSVYDTNNNSYLSFRYGSTAGVILKANSDTNVPIQLTYSQAVDTIDERSQALNSDIEFEFTEYVNPDPDPDPDIDPETDPETDPDVDPETDPSTDPSTDPETDSSTKNGSENEPAAIPKSGDVQIGYIIAIAVCALLVIAVLLSGRKCGLFALALALLLVMPISAKASGNSQSTDDGSGSESETVSCTVNVSGTIQLNDKIAVTYDYGDGRTPEVCAADYLGSVPSPSEETPVRDGYTFDGWYDIAENEPSFYSQVGYDLTFTAKWTANIYRITYTLDGGVLESANPTTYKITDPNITLNNPTKNGYYFIGWREDGTSDAVNQLTIESGSFGDKTFIAAFTPYLSASIKKYSESDTKVSYVQDPVDKTYDITQAANSSGLGADGAVCDNSGITAMWGDTYLLEFTLFLNDDGRFMIKPGCTIDGVSGNDGYGECRITIDNVTYAGDSDRIANGVALKAGVCHTIAIRLRNNNFDINLNQDNFVGCTTFGLQTGSSSATYEIRDLKSAVFIEQPTHYKKEGEAKYIRFLPPFLFSCFPAHFLTDFAISVTRKLLSVIIFTDQPYLLL